MSEYIKREDVLDYLTIILIDLGYRKVDEIKEYIKKLPSADVVERDEGIRMGAELAAMHGSDATSQDLERAYWTGYEEAMKKRDVRPVVRGRWVGYPECLKYMNAYSDDHIVCSACEECFSILDNDCERFNFCPNCGADMRGDEDV